MARWRLDLIRAAVAHPKSSTARKAALDAVAVGDRVADLSNNVNYRFRASVRNISRICSSTM